MVSIAYLYQDLWNNVSIAYKKREPNIVGRIVKICFHERLLTVINH